MAGRPVVHKFDIALTPWRRESAVRDFLLSDGPAALPPWRSNDLRHPVDSRSYRLVSLPGDAPTCNALAR